MTTPDRPEESALFREEALDHQARRRGPGSVLRLAPAWSSWAYWALVSLVAAGLLASWLVRVDGQRLLLILMGRG